MVHVRRREPEEANSELAVGNENENNNNNNNNCGRAARLLRNCCDWKTGENSPENSIASCLTLAQMLLTRRPNAQANFLKLENEKEKKKKKEKKRREILYETKPEWLPSFGPPLAIDVSSAPPPPLVVGTFLPWLSVATCS